MSETHPAETHVRLRLESGYRFKISFDGPADFAAGSLVTDEPPPLGEGSGPNPLAMLATAVGSCLASSLLFCLPTAMADGTPAQPSAGTGTVMRPATLRRYAQEAGFRAVEILPIEHDMFRFYRLAG